MSRTNIDIDDELCQRVMARYHLTTKREAVDMALRHLAGEPLDLDEARALRGGSCPHCGDSRADHLRRAGRLVS